MLLNISRVTQFSLEVFTWTLRDHLQVLEWFRRHVDSVRTFLVLMDGIVLTFDSGKRMARIIGEIKQLLTKLNGFWAAVCQTFFFFFNFAQIWLKLSIKYNQSCHLLANLTFGEIIHQNWRSKAIESAVRCPDDPFSDYFRIHIK